MHYVSELHACHQVVIILTDILLILFLPLVTTVGIETGHLAHE
jgi:hypothetical protein